MRSRCGLRAGPPAPPRSSSSPPLGGASPPARSRLRGRLTAARAAGRIRARMQLRIIPKKRGGEQSGSLVQADTLRARGKRLTRPRRLILDLVRSTDAHPSAALVYREVRRHLPRVSLATVYRNLRMLAAEGLLSERAEDRKSTRLNSSHLGISYA